MATLEEIRDQVFTELVEEGTAKQERMIESFERVTGEAGTVPTMLLMPFLDHIVGLGVMTSENALKDAVAGKNGLHPDQALNAAFSTVGALGIAIGYIIGKRHATDDPLG